MIHNYAERNNESYTLSIASLRNELQKIEEAKIQERPALIRILGNLLSSGLLPSEKPTDPDAQFIAEMEAKGITITPVPLVQ